ncbi:VOC family protein [Serratia sp. PF2-63]|uniref:VOC family protein n=1 Tax=unclassified Serratia (in: enterobacteria) TaxID=2647522 RepID=UPI0024AEFD32|nr:MULTISPECIES: VOC family protein [unclassified Serratia (in: enterobacteria)]EMB6252938.1 VOC family protein [Serratia marcescens]MDI6974291.1 VOC family protein [Serratia sp. Se-RSBMAAmG]MDI9262577.1 VOC family protein [Serratia sp. PF2-63]MDI9270924.1 VOC family protein [Serratia sp. PF-27]
MAIIGIQALTYGVEDVEESTRFFVDFGLPLVSSDADESVFRLDEGSEVRILALSDRRLPLSSLVGPGVREVVLGVDNAASLDSLVEGLRRDREVRIENGIAYFLSDGGLPLALQVFIKRPVINAPDPINAPGVVRRLNTHRKWRQRARPKTIGHVVFAVPDFIRCSAFFRERLGFRVSDYQHGVGIYLRADGSNNHHSFLAVNANAPFPGMDGQARFHHANFGVEDIDELMVGVNHMGRQGWTKSIVGLGRHRVDSALFVYLPCPAGGEAEYGTDSDYVDDTWVPREWPVPLFAYSHWTHNQPTFLDTPPAWEFRYLTDGRIPDEIVEHNQAGAIDGEASCPEK